MQRKLQTIESRDEASRYLLWWRGYATCLRRQRDKLRCCVIYFASWVWLYRADPRRGFLKVGRSSVACASTAMERFGLACSVASWQFVASREKCAISRKRNTYKRYVLKMLVLSWKRAIRAASRQNATRRKRRSRRQNAKCRQADGLSDSATEDCYRCKKEEAKMVLFCDNKECKVLPNDSGDFWGEQRGVHWLGERRIEFMVCNSCGHSMFPCPYCGAITKDALNVPVGFNLGVVVSAQPPVWSFNDEAA